jgi:hypothetical protein
VGLTWGADGAGAAELSLLVDTSSIPARIMLSRTGESTGTDLSKEQKMV